MNNISTPDKWTHQNDTLTRQFIFQDFSEAWAFLSRVALLAESHKHHPHIENTYNSVTIRLNTHDAGDIVTEKDIDMAKAIDAL